MTDNSLRNRYRRDFTSEIIKSHPTAPSADSQVSDKVNPVGKFFRALPQSALLRDIIICVAIVVVGLVALNRHSSTVQTPQSTPQAQAPAVSQKQPASDNKTSTLGASSSTPSTTQSPSSLGSLPTSFHSNNDRQTSNGITTYYISDDSKNTYNVVDEPLTANNTQDSFSRSLTSTETLTVNLGKAVIGDNNSLVLAGIQTSNNHLIIVAAPATNLRTQLETLIKSM